jgi:hypothetical protein
VSDVDLFTASAIRGYRYWTLNVGQVVGLHGTPWRSHVLAAECRSAGGASPPHLEARGACSGRCGINAYDSPRRLVAAARSSPAGRRRLAPSSPDVGLPIPEGLYGEVALSGRVVEHEWGYRAERARVVRLLYVHANRIEAATDPGVIAAQFPSPSWAGERFEIGLRFEDPGQIPEGIERLLVS